MALKTKDIEFMLDLFEKIDTHLNEYESLLWNKMQKSEGEEAEDYRTVYLSVGAQIQKLEIAAYILEIYLEDK